MRDGALLGLFYFPARYKMKYYFSERQLTKPTDPIYIQLHYFEAVQVCMLVMMETVYYGFFDLLGILASYFN